MKYAIYDKAADGYLTKMEFEVGYSEHTQFECGLNEYITEAKLLDTPKEAADAIVRIESFNFMDKSRFVMHSFDETLADQYIISEAGNPTKVVDNITVDLDGTINVKYGTMAYHWSASSLEYAVNRMNALQKAKNPKYTSWCNTFDIYKVITVTDERSCTHYQFIKVTEKGLTEYAKNEVDPLNKRIEELEGANYDLGEKAAVRGEIANRLQEENDDLKTKVESIKKEAHRWKTMYESAVEHREALKDVIDTIYTDLKSANAYGYKSYRLKAALNAFKCEDTLNHISMPTEVYYIQKNGVCLTAKDEACAIIDQILTIMESRELDQRRGFSAAKDIKIAQDIAEKIIPICEADDEFDVTLKKFSELYKAVNTIYDCNNDSILYAFNAVLEIFAALESQVRNIIDENVTWKNKAMKAVKDLNDQKILNKVNSDTIDRMVVEKRAMNNELSDAVDALEEVNDKNEGLANMLKEITDCVGDIMVATQTIDNNKMISNLTDVSLKIGVKTIDDGPIYGISVILNILIRKIKEAIRDSLAEVIYAIRNAIYNNNSDAFCCIENRMKIDPDFNSNPFMAGVRENIKDICAAEKKNIANNYLKNSEIARLTEERDKALERAEFYKRMANSVYGIIMSNRCNGKQAFCDIVNGKKILVDKKKYDDLVEYVANINLTYDNMFCMMDKPVYLSTITESLNDLTK